DSVPGDPRDGARSLCATGQGGLPAEQRLGRGAGGGLHVVARVLPAGLLCRGAGEVPVPALQGRQSARQAESAVRLTWLRPPASSSTAVVVTLRETTSGGSARTVGR